MLLNHTGEHQGQPARMHFETPSSERVQYEITCIPPKDTELSFSQLYEGEYTKEHVAKFKARLGQWLAGHNVINAYAPTVVHMSGVVLKPERFSERIILPCGVHLWRPKDRCDGLEVPRFSAMTMAPAGCALLVLSFIDKAGKPVCIAAHAGRNSLIDMRAVHKGKRSRAYFSIIDAMVAYGTKLDVPPEDMTLRSFFAIPWQAFPHATNDKKRKLDNIRLLADLTFRYGYDVVRVENGLEHLWMSKLVELQARQSRIGIIDVHGYELPLNRLYAHGNHQTPSLSGTARNWVALVHR